MLLGPDDHNPHAVQSARTFQIWSLLALATALPASCGPGLPSEVPLGGIEDSTESESSLGGSSRAPKAENGQGEGGATDDGEEAEAHEGEGEADDTIEVAAATAPGKKQDEQKNDKKQGDKKPAAEAATSAGATAPACDDTTGTAPSCGVLKSGACGAVFGPLCEQLGEALKPKIATSIVECLVENNRRSRCESIEECLKQGLEQACVSPPDREVCEKWFARCDPPEEGPWQDVDHCARGVASLKKTARTKVIECLDDSCDLEACFLKVGK